MLMLILIQIVQVLKGAIFSLDPENYISNSDEDESPRYTSKRKLVLIAIKIRLVLLEIKLRLELVGIKT